MKTKLLLLLTLLLTSQQFAQAYTLNGKRWVEPVYTVVLPSTLNDPALVKRVRFIMQQIKNNVPMRVRFKVLDGAFTGIFEALDFARETNSVYVLYQPGEDYGLGTRVANCGFIASRGSTEVHAGLIRINDIRYKEVTAGGDINYLAQVIGHELCHKLGLGHSKKKDRKPDPIMSIGKFKRFNRKHFGLTRDDKRGLREIY